MQSTWVALATAFLKEILGYFSAYKVGVFNERAKQAEKSSESDKSAKKAAARIRAMSRDARRKWMQDNGLVRGSDTSSDDA